MATFKGFNTINQDKKFSLTDFDLIKRDLLNSFLIRPGTMPGKPRVGSDIWNYVFDPMDGITHSKIEDEIKKIIGYDTRLQFVTLDISYTENIVMVAVSVKVKPSMSVLRFTLNFLRDQDTASIT